MEARVDLTQGKIAQKLIKLSIPIMGTSFIQMAYNMIDMIWVGKIGSNAVAAVGTAGFYPWLAMALVAISKVGGEIKVAQSIGEKNVSKTKSYIKSAIEINIILAIIYTIVLLIFNKQLIGIFKLGDADVVGMSEEFLIILAIGMVSYFINPVFTAIFNGLGNSKTPFRLNAIGLVTNIVLDPILIFGIGPIPALGVKGAAIATISAQFVITLCFLFIILRSSEDYFKVKLFRKIEFDFYKSLYKLGIPVAIQSGMFTIFSMAIGIIVAAFGPVAVAVQKVGSQIEAISWMSAEGLAVALGSFVGQNYGAKKYDRINKGCKISIGVALIWGSFTTIVLVFFGATIFKGFINESDAMVKGAQYLRIIGYSQLFMCIEIIISGAFRGLGRTYIPSTIVTIFTGLRLPMAIFLSKKDILGLDGVWWSVSLSSMIKGILLLTIFIVLIKANKFFKKDSKEINDSQTIIN